MQQKPREKLGVLGPHELEDHELFEIILGRGNRRESVFETVKRVLRGYDRQELLKTTDLKTFQKTFGVSFVHACQLIAAMEIGRRFFITRTSDITLRSSDQVYAQIKDMQNLRKEHLKGFYVNTRYRLIHEETISIGGLNSNIIHPREIFRPAIEYGAYAVIIAHNHPSGDKTPSKEDEKVTAILIKTGEILQIPLLDHLIIGQNGYTSFQKRSSLSKKPFFC